MSREQSDEEDSMVETEVVPVDDETTETEVEFRRPRGSDPGPDWMPKYIPVITGAVGAEADTHDPGQTRRRLGPLSGAKPKRPRFELPIQQIPGPRRLPPDVGTQPVKPVKPVTDRISFEMSTPMYPGPARQLPSAGTQPVTDRFMYELPLRIRTPLVLNRSGDVLSDMPNSRHKKLPRRVEVCDSIRSPEADLMDTVAHLQLEVKALKFVQSGPSTLATKIPPVKSKPVAFTSTKVPKFTGVTSWDQNRQVFDAIVWSNGWDDVTVSLQLLSYLEGDTLNVTLFVPEIKRVMRAGLVGALTEHYRSPGRLAEYRRQFERTTRQEGEDRSIVAIALETLAVKALADMGPYVREGHADSPRPEDCETGGGEGHTGIHCGRTGVCAG